MKFLHVRLVPIQLPHLILHFMISQLALMLIPLVAGAELPKLQTDGFASAEANYPLKIGNTWQFEMTTGGTKQPMDYKVAKAETVDKVPMYRVDTIINNSVVASESLGSNQKGLFRYRFGGFSIDPPICLLRNPVRPGDSWSVDTAAGDQKLTVICEVSTETVKVPAGEFDAIKLIAKSIANNIEVKSTYWLAAEVGIVRQILVIGDKTMTMELQKFNVGTP